MLKKFQTLVDKMSPESRKRAAFKTEEILQAAVPSLTGQSFLDGLGEIKPLELSQPALRAPISNNQIWDKLLCMEQILKKIGGANEDR